MTLLYLRNRSFYWQLQVDELPNVLLLHYHNHYKHTVDRMYQFQSNQVDNKQSTNTNIEFDRNATGFTWPTRITDE